MDDRERIEGLIERQHPIERKVEDFTRLRTEFPESRPVLRFRTATGLDLGGIMGHSEVWVRFVFLGRKYPPTRAAVIANLLFEPQRAPAIDLVLTARSLRGSADAPIAIRESDRGRWSYELTPPLPAEDHPVLMLLHSTQEGGRIAQSAILTVPLPKPFSSASTDGNLIPIHGIPDAGFEKMYFISDIVVWMQFYIQGKWEAHAKQLDDMWLIKSQE